MPEALKVLIAEDDPAVADFLTLAFRAMGRSVVHASDGQGALARLEDSGPFGLVMLDALLPKLDGFQVLAELRKKHRDLPVVMMSGIYKKRSYEQEAQKLGAMEYLHKPISVLKVWELAESHVTTGGMVGDDVIGTPLATQPLPFVARDLRDRKATGLLFVRSPLHSAVLFFEDGEIIFGRSDDPETRLDRVLASAGKLTGAAVDRASKLLNTLSRKGLRFGEVLVKEGLIEATDLQEALGPQQRLHVTRPFTWTEGTSEFFETDAPRQEKFKLEMDMDGLLFWACRHLEDGPQLEVSLPDPSCKIALTAGLQGDAERLGLQAPELELLALLDGTRTVGKIRAISRLAQVDFNRLLAGLVVIERIKVMGEARPASRHELSTGFAAPSRGDLTALAPARLLVGNYFSHRTGVLRFESASKTGAVVRTVFFEGGDVAFANSNDPNDRLGQVLLRSQLLNRDQLQAALAASREREGVGLGRILIDQGVLKLDDLHRALVMQVQHVVEGIVSCKEGAFTFKSGPLPSTEIVPLDLDTLQLVIEGLRQCPFGAIALRLPDKHAQLRKTWHCYEVAESVTLTAMEQELLEKIARFPRLADLLAQEREAQEEALRAVHALITIGLIEELPQAGEPGAIQAQGDATCEMKVAEKMTSPPLFDTGSEDFGVPGETPAAPPAAATPEPQTAPAEPSDEDWGEESFGGSLSSEEEDESFDPPGKEYTTPEPAVAKPSSDTLVGEGAVSFADLNEPSLPTSAMEVTAADQALINDGAVSFADLNDDGDRASSEPVLVDPELSQPIPEPESGLLFDFGDDVGDFDFLDEAQSGGQQLTHQASRLSEPFGNETVPPSAAVAALVEATTALAAAPRPRQQHGVDTMDTSVSMNKADEATFLVAVHDFLTNLGTHLKLMPGSLPEELLATLPDDIRQRFGL